MAQCRLSASARAAQCISNPYYGKRRRQGVANVARLAPFERMNDPDLTYDGRSPVLLEGDAGDVFLFVSDLWHRGLPAAETVV